MLTQMPISTVHPAASALATLREHLDLEVAEFDEHGRYVLEFEAMSAIVDAVHEIEELLDDDAKGDGQ